MYTVDVKLRFFFIYFCRLFGFKRKMIFVIVRWYSSVRFFSDVLELVYVDRFEVEM